MIPLAQPDEMLQLPPTALLKTGATTFWGTMVRWMPLFEQLHYRKPRPEDMIEYTARVSNGAYTTQDR